MKFKKQNQNGGTQTCIVRAYRSFVDSLNFTNKANLHAFEVEIHTQQKLCHFGRNVVKAKLVCPAKKFRRGHPVGVFIWKNFHPGH